MDKLKTKPGDYDIYFYPDGKERPNPYFHEDGHIMEEKFFEARRWARRMVEIKRSLMTNEERERYDEMIANLHAKWS